MTVTGQDGTYNSSTGLVVGSGSLTSNSTDPVTLTSVGTYGGVTQTYHATLTPNGGVTQMFYGNASGTNYRASPWTGSAWGASASIGSVSPNNPQSLIAQQCPTRTEQALECLDSGANVNLFIETGSTWAAPVLVSSNCGDGAERPFDLAYMPSGTLLAAYRVGAGPTVHYRTWDGTTLSADSSITFSGTDNATFIRLVPSPSTNQVILLMVDGSKNVFGAVWNGSTWIKAKKLQATALGDVGTLKAFPAALANYFRHCPLSSVKLPAPHLPILHSWDGVKLGHSQPPAPPLLGAASPTGGSRCRQTCQSNSIIMGEQDDGKNVEFLVWNGSSWGTPIEVETNVISTNRRDFDVCYGAQRHHVAWASGAITPKPTCSTALGTVQLGPLPSQVLRWLILLKTSNSFRRRL